MIRDFLLRQSSSQSFDLAELYAGGTGFAVETEDGTKVNATIDGQTLHLAPGALGHADLTLRYTDAEGQSATDVFRAIVAGENAYTFAIFPDTQSYTSSSDPEVQALFGRMSDYVVEHKDSLGILHVVHVGDIVEFGAPEQWALAAEAMGRLDGEVSYTLGVGNHDQQRPGFASAFSFESDIDDYFTAEQVGATTAQGGGTYDGFDVGPDTFDNGNSYSDSIRNHYTTIAAPDGTDWLILSLEFGAPDDVLRWASEVIEGHLDHRVIIDTHSWNGGDKRVDPTTEPLTGENGGWGYGIRDNPRNVNDGEDMWRELASKYPNIAFTFNGHNFLDGAETVVSEAAGGNDVLQMFVNYQNGISDEITGAGDSSLGGRGGNGALRLVVIDPDNDQITTHAKFTGLDLFYERVDHQETFRGVELGAPETIAIAKAGGTEVVAAGVDGTAQVALDPSATIPPADDASGTVRYEWFDADGRSLGKTDGAGLETELGYGVNRLTLVATDAEGNVSRDGKTVIVEGPENLLTDTFDDGDAEGWSGPAEPAAFFELGTDLGLGLPSLAGAAQIAMRLRFASSFRPYDEMTGEVAISFDEGETFTNLLTLDTGTVPGGTSSLSRANEGIELDFLAPASASSAIVSFRMRDGGNDWWWAVDDVALVALTEDGEVSLLAEDFDDLAPDLQPAADEAIREDLLGWTHVPPEGWTFDVAATTPQGATEWQGWSFVTPEFWTAADQQQRSTFTLGTGVIAVADPDEWDDFNDGTQTGGDFDTTIATPAVDLIPAGGGQPEGEIAGVIQLDALTGTQGISVSTGLPVEVQEYTILFDLYLAAGEAASFTALYQTDAANGDDAEIYIREDGGVGILDQYDGNFAFDAWNRVALSFAVEDGAQVMRKYIDGNFVGAQIVDADVSDGSRWTIDGEDGLLLFADPNGFTSRLAAGAVAVTPEVLSDAQIAALGGADADGPLDSETAAVGAVQMGFDGVIDDLDVGGAIVEARDTAQADSSMIVKGSIFGNPDGKGEAAVYAQSDLADERLIHQGEGAGDWSEYVFETVVEAADNDTIGALFYYEDEDNHYALTISLQDFTRTLSRVRDCEVTVLAQEAGGYRHFAPTDLRIAVGAAGIVATLDDDVLFDGPVIDADPLASGSVGLLAQSMDRVTFDDVTVNRQVLQAHASGETQGADADGDGIETLALSAAGSVAPDGVARYEWLVDGTVAATGREADVAVGTGASEVTLRISDATGAASEDVIAVAVAAQSDILLAESFTAGARDFAIVDQGTIDAPSEWSVRAGDFLQESDIRSEQQETGFGAWSLGGEGAYILREGTFALYENGSNWTDYAVEVTARPGDDDGVGLMFRYQDEDNHYKLEIDEQEGVVQLVRNQDGYETVLARGWAGYAPGEDLVLRVEAEGSRLVASVNGVDAFGSEVTDDTFTDGSIALYAWASEDLAFEDVTVTRLGDGPAPLPRIAGMAGRDRLQGTEADEIFENLIGSDVIRTGGGNDVLDLRATLANDARDSLLVRAEAGDTLTLAGATESDVTAIYERGARIVLRLGEDGDQVSILGLDADALIFTDDFLFA